MRSIFYLGMLILGASFLACQGKKSEAKPNVAEVKDAPEKVEKKSVAEPAPAPKNEPLVLFSWPTQTAQFELTLESELGAMSEQSVMTVKLVATLDVMGVKDGRDNGQVVFALVNPVLSVSGAKDAKQMAQLQRELRSPVLGVFTGGVLQRLQVEPHLTTFTVGIWRSLLSYIQIADAPDGKVPFEVSEFDGNGKYIAEYQTVDGGGWLKRKQRYVSTLWENALGGNDGNQPKPKLISSEIRITVFEEKIKRIVANDRLKVDIVGAGYLLSNTSLQLNASEDVPDMAAVVAALPAQMTVLRADEPFVAELPIDAMDTQRMQGLTFDQVLEALKTKAVDPRGQKLWQKKNDEAVDSEQKMAAEQWTEDWSRYFSALPAFFRQQPRTVRRADREIRSGNPAARSLIGGLASSGVGEAQQVLLNISLDEKLDMDLRESAIRNLVQCNHPTVEIAKAIQALGTHDLLSRYAIFGTGIIARNLNQDGHREEGWKLVQWLLSLLDTETDTNRRNDIFAGISNSADGRMMPQVKQWLQSATPEMRAGAVESMRLLGMPEVDDILAQHMDESLELSPMVRRSAIYTAARREKKDPLLSGLIKVAKNDSDQKTRREARKVLHNWSREVPELMQTLEDIAAKEEATSPLSDTLN